ncbi:hypothetical protein WMY93_025191 [Mugilogobius chulae]|uniref:DNA-directed RNA polymerase n=1 Tax=Mugilogobius chulae TaxID=88201 RepID=A0AAW0N1U6_9GOBI
MTSTVCAFSKCVKSSGVLLEKCAARAFPVNCCPLCLNIRKSSRITEYYLNLQRRKLSFLIPKSDDKKRLLEQSLVDVLEARIQQLQSDVILDVQHAKVQLVSARSSGTGALSGKSPRKQPQAKTEQPKSSKSKSSSKSQPSRWMEKLSQEKKNKINKEQHLRQKIQNKDTKASKGSQMLPGTSHKTISTTVKKTAPSKKKTKKRMKLSDEIRAAVASTSAAGTTSLSQKVSRGNRLINIALNEEDLGNTLTETKGRASVLAEAEVLEKRLSDQLRQLSSSNTTYSPEPNQDPSTYIAELQHSIHSYLEACVFAKDIERANRFLLSQHRVMSRRKHLNTDIYNVMMRVWAKKGTLNHIGRIFILLEEAGLKPNLGSYSAALECMGRNSKCPPRVITRCLNQMEEDGVSVDDLFSHPSLTQRENSSTLHWWRILHSEGGASISQTALHQATATGAFQPAAQHGAGLHCHHRLCGGVQTGHGKHGQNEEAVVRAEDTMAQTLLQALKENKMILSNTNSRDYRLNLYPYLCLLDDSEYVDIMVQSVANMPPSGESLKIMARDLGSRVYTKYSVRQKQQNHMVQKMSNIYNSYTDILAKDTQASSVLPRERWNELETNNTNGPTLRGAEANWPYIVTLELGIYLMDLMVKNLKINSDILNPAYERKLIPVLYHMYTFRSTRQMEPHSMRLCWRRAKLQPVMDSLNQLGNCAWKVNKPLLDIIISIFNDKGSDKLDIPPPMSEAPKIPHFNPQDQSYTASEKAQMKREVVIAKKKCGEMHSLRMDALYKLSIANTCEMRSSGSLIAWTSEVGRTLSTYFNHLGSDVTRAILLFAEGKPLGPKGLDWLKIHLVNLTGLKKRSSLQERLEYANSIMEDILDSAHNPLNGRNWWMNADEPWQALACCMEIANAVRSPDPQQFISHFPVHQDGSCNGLQHYAALAETLLVPHQSTSCLVTCPRTSTVEWRSCGPRCRERPKNCSGPGGLHQSEGGQADCDDCGLGVTRYGGRLQIEKRLKEIDDFPQEYVWDASHYLVRLVFSGLKEMFTGTREIQDWLTESARLISKSGHTVEWVTPLGLPIIQPYHRKRTQVLKSTMQHINLQISHDTKERPDTVKQKNAFPPNFIHSLDSTHMMLTSLHCHSAGLTFVSVHDCFWTHAVTVDVMNKICREQFVALHSQPILQDLSDFLLQKYCEGPMTDAKNKKYQEYRRMMMLLSKVPQTGDFNLELVKDSTYFFS